MSNTLNARQRAVKHEARLTWLRAHPDLIARLPSAVEDVDDAKRAALDDAYTRMVNSGLYSRTSDRKSARWGIRLLVSELRREHVPDARQRYRS